MRFFYLFLYELKHAFVQIRQHFMLCLSAMSAILVSMCLISLFLIIGLHIDSFSHNIESDVRIHVILNGDISDTTQIESIQQQIESMDNVKTVVFSSKDEELELMIQEKGDAFEIYRGEENPLANAFFVTVEDGTKIDKTAKKIEAMDEVASIAYGGSSVMDLMNLLNKIRYVGYGVVALLLGLSLYLIYNTIRTTIYSQQEEIGIMATVGATHRFIRIPYELQGIFIGFVGSLLTYFIINFAYQKIYEMANGVLFVNVLRLIKPQEMGTTLCLVILMTGILLGWLASFIAVSKYVKQNR